ncbi:hypothetical protein [Gracilimonas sp.]|uniref:hypothetical protein n=1 Tax=Gracilimonas sp. TaxID=1974203 RepID=UPI0032ED8253
MSRFRNYISIAFLFLAVTGTLISMAHYHSEGLECLHHANEQHYAETDPVCPVCTIVTYTPVTEPSSSIHILEYQESLISIPEFFISDEPFTPLLGRAPPATV